MSETFAPDFDNAQQLTCSLTSQRTALSGHCKYYIQNIGLVSVYIKFGDNTVDADDTGILLESKNSINIDTCYEYTHMAYIATANSPEINIIPWR
jgi:hypothetical protein